MKKEEKVINNIIIEAKTEHGIQYWNPAIGNISSDINNVKVAGVEYVIIPRDESNIQKGLFVCENDDKTGAVIIGFCCMNVSLNLAVDYDNEEKDEAFYLYLSREWSVIDKVIIDKGQVWARLNEFNKPFPEGILEGLKISPVTGCVYYSPRTVMTTELAAQQKKEEESFKFFSFEAMKTPLYGFTAENAVVLNGEEGKRLLASVL